MVKLLRNPVSYVNEILANKCGVRYRWSQQGYIATLALLRNQFTFCSVYPLNLSYHPIFEVVVEIQIPNRRKY